MNYLNAQVMETPKVTTSNGWDNVFSQPIDITKPIFVELNVVAKANGDAHVWAKTGVWVPVLGVYTPVLGGDGLRNVFGEIQTALATGWNTRVEIIDGHLNIDINGQAATTIQWIVRVEYMQWP